MSDLIPEFIVIDDSRLDCFISEKIIKNTCADCPVRSFNEATEALQVIKETSSTKNKTIILLDIQMPVMNGFDFAEAFENLAEEQKAGYSIYMISSSTNETDRIRIGNYPCIRHLYKKPITKDIVTELLAQIMFAG